MSKHELGLQKNTDAGNYFIERMKVEMLLKVKTLCTSQIFTKQDKAQK